MSSAPTRTLSGACSGAASPSDLMPLPSPLPLVLRLCLVLAFLTGVCPPAESQTPKKGGVLQTVLIEDPPGLLAHESATVSNVWPMSPCYSNLVLFHPLKMLESADTVIPELAERWSWQDNYRNLVFFLRKNVKWHDGKPLTSRDVKYTFDVAREAPEAPTKFRLSPRKDWWVNVEAIEAPEPHTVVFRLKRPQPSLLLMLASGYSPIYPAHVPLADLKTTCVGTGPYKLKEYRPGEFVEYVKNPDYFVKGRPYLDGVKWIHIKDRSTQIAALQAGQLDVGGSGWNKANAETAKKGKPELIVTENDSNVNDNVLVNFKRAPLNDTRVRRAINLALDRKAYLVGPRLGAATFGGAMQPRPTGVWGLPPAEVATLPGMGDPVKQKAEARTLLAAAGFGA